MGVNEDSGKRSLKSGTPKKAVHLLLFPGHIGGDGVECPGISHDGAFRGSAVQRVPEGTGCRKCEGCVCQQWGITDSVYEKGPEAVECQL